MSKQKSAADLMPQSEEAQVILRARAEQLAKEKTEIIESHEGISFVHFGLSKTELYGIPYQYVKEVLHKIKPCPLPCTPAYVAGVINWRGALIPVIDLKQFLHSESAKNINYAYGIIIRAADETIGILADSIEGSDTYQPLSLGSPLASVNAANPEYIIGIHQGATAIINMEAVVSALRLEMDKFHH